MTTKRALLEDCMDINKTENSGIPYSDTSGNIKISIEVTSLLKEDFGCTTLDNLILEEIVRPGISIVELIRILAAKYPQFAKKALDRKEGLSGYCVIVLNGRMISSVELETRLVEGDVIKLISGLYGG